MSSNSQASEMVTKAQASIKFLEDAFKKASQNYLEKWQKDFEEEMKARKPQVYPKSLDTSQNGITITKHDGSTVFSEWPSQDAPVNLTDEQKEVLQNVPTMREFLIERRSQDGSRSFGFQQVDPETYGKKNGELVPLQLSDVSDNFIHGIASFATHEEDQEKEDLRSQLQKLQARIEEQDRKIAMMESEKTTKSNPDGEAIARGIANELKEKPMRFKL